MRPFVCGLPMMRTGTSSLLIPPVPRRKDVERLTMANSELGSPGKLGRTRGAPFHVWLDSGTGWTRVRISMYSAWSLSGVEHHNIVTLCKSRRHRDIVQQMGKRSFCCRTRDTRSAACCADRHTLLRGLRNHLLSSRAHETRMHQPQAGFQPVAPFRLARYNRPLIPFTEKVIQFIPVSVPLDRSVSRSKWWCRPHTDECPRPNTWAGHMDKTSICGILRRMNTFASINYLVAISKKLAWVAQWSSDSPQRVTYSSSSTLHIRVWTAITRNVHSSDFIFNALVKSRQGMETEHDVYCSECGTLTIKRQKDTNEGGAPDIYLARVSPLRFNLSKYQSTLPRGSPSGRQAKPFSQQTVTWGRWWLDNSVLGVSAGAFCDTCHGIHWQPPAVDEDVQPTSYLCNSSLVAGATRTLVEIISLLELVEAGTRNNPNKFLWFLSLGVLPVDSICKTFANCIHQQPLALVSNNCDYGRSWLQELAQVVGEVGRDATTVSCIYKWYHKTQDYNQVAPRSGCPCKFTKSDARRAVTTKLRPMIQVGLKSVALSPMDYETERGNKGPRGMVMGRGQQGLGYGFIVRCTYGQLGAWAMGRSELRMD
ncbi:hypothetical protein AG1IA_03541 [Rhizoctonia solani AG-1 IA]|uniref:Uncharacterized protein n=1 Tax=Thanatephorus cucumeris (strain AG1-IA) TaxID=983506 RepID=L8WWR4_THACA|nr:hypothetical protein AG1IA_03541 [Rhizoctonia solani AG-1 IA]